MSLRIRQVKPDYWRDDRLATLTDTERLVYIGLWMVADDAGWFRESVTGIATDLFPYLSRPARERRVSGALATLKALGRIESHPCGHSHIPHLTDHQRLASSDKQVRTSLREHERCPSPVTPAGPAGSCRQFPMPRARARRREGIWRGRV